jgi:hypothetical protein
MGGFTEFPVITEAVRGELIQFARQPHTSLAGTIFSVAAVWVILVISNLAEIFPAFATQSAGGFLPDILLGIGVSALIILRRFWQKKHDALGDLQTGRCTVEQFTVCGKHEHGEKGMRYILTDSANNAYQCTSLLTFREVQIGSMVYGVRCACGVGFVPQNFNIMY